jgi:hypothetical protein
VCALPSELEGVVVGVREPGIAFTLEGGELPGYVCEVSGEVYCSVLVISWLAYALQRLAAALNHWAL